MTFDNMKLSNRTYSNHVYSDMTLNKMIWPTNSSKNIIIKDSGTRTAMTPTRPARTLVLVMTYRYKKGFAKNAFTPG